MRNVRIFSRKTRLGVCIAPEMRRQKKWQGPWVRFRCDAVIRQCMAC
jgi:hypothetical protein